MTPFKSSKNFRRKEDDSLGEGFSWSQNDSKTVRRNNRNIPGFVVGTPRSKLYHPSRHLFLKYFAEFLLAVIAIVSIIFGIVATVSGFSQYANFGGFVVGIVGIIIGVIAIVLFRKIKIWKNVVVGEARGFNQSEEGKNNQKIKVYRFGIQVLKITSDISTY